MRARVSEPMIRHGSGSGPIHPCIALYACSPGANDGQALKFLARVDSRARSLGPLSQLVLGITTLLGLLGRRALVIGNPRGNLTRTEKFSHGKSSNMMRSTINAYIQASATGRCVCVFCTPAHRAKCARQWHTPWTTHPHPPQA